LSIVDLYTDAPCTSKVSNLVGVFGRTSLIFHI